MKTLLSSLLLVLWSPLGARPAAQEDESEDGARGFFAIPMARDTRELASVAREHLAAGRTDDALDALQELLDQHGGEVLPAKWRETHGQFSTFAAYPGAAEWALARLQELPDAARAEYRARYEPRAAEALARAVRTPERTALVAIAKRFPLAPSAVRAWWCLGDIELESGHLEDARLAWQRALDLSQHLALPEPPGGRARLEEVSARLAREHASARPEASTLPRGDAEPWVTPLDLTPFGPRGNQQVHSNLQPIAYGARLFVCSTLRLFALDAFTGEIVWQAGPAGGWSSLPGLGADRSPGGDYKLFKGINYEQLILAPAAGDGVVVAVLQAPFTENDNEEWQTIEIMKAIPERRLHAFDIASGRELWNHEPPLIWNEGESRREGDESWRWDGGGSYAQKMMVAGSPTVAGARVLVPCYRMQGRIDYQVACYELASGRLLWNTPVISGQRERNMFGRSSVEFSAAALVVAGNRVIAQTELGTVAALDLFTGRILWQSLYKQIPLPKTRSYRPPTRQTTWRLAPPVVVGDVIVATPSDSSEITAFLLADGRVPWSYPESQLRNLDRGTDALNFDLLVGADADTVYLSGAKLCALQKAGGLATAPMFSARWTQSWSGRSEYLPRAVLTADALLVPNANERAAFDRRTGARIAASSGPWKGGDAGSLWVEDGALFSLSPQSLAGYFDWQALLERARRDSVNASTPAALRSAAELFQRRGQLSLEQHDLDQALACLREARGLHERLRKQNERSEPSHAECTCLCTLARTLVLAGRDQEALDVLAEGRALGATGADLFALLFAEERILRANGGEPRVALLDQLEQACPELPLPAETWAESAPSWLAGTPALGETPSGVTLPTGLWVAVERAGERVRQGDLGRALQDLHSALERTRELEPPAGETLSALVRGRIARVLALPGGSAAYAPIEERARTQFAAARAAHDARSLEEIAELYPHSEAARQALNERLERAMEERDAATATALVSSALAGGALTPESENAILLRLACVLGARGNTAFEQALVRTLARARPDFVSDVPQHGGRSLAALAAELGPELGVEAATPPSPVLFDAHVTALGRAREGRFEFLGSIPPAALTAEGAPRELHVYATRDALEVYSSRSPEKALWTRALEQPLEGGRRACAAARGRLFYGTRAGLVCLDELGNELWTRSTDGEAARRVVEWNGLVVAARRSGRVQVLDALLGSLLWQQDLGAGGDWSGPVVGDGRAVFFSDLPALSPRVLVFDLFRGRVLADFRLAGLDARAALEDTAWIDGERLIAAAFQRQPAQLAAFSLADGKRVWTIPFGSDEELFALPTCAGRCYPVTLATSLGNTAGNGGIYELDEASGTIRRVVPLKAGERVMGLAPDSHDELAAPYLFTSSASENDHGVPIRAIHLPYGNIWTWSLPVSAREFYDGRNLPMPAVSADYVAIAYQTRRAGGSPGSDSTLVFVDKRAGKRVDSLTLGAEFAGARNLELRGLGEMLFVLGQGPVPRASCLGLLGKRP